MPIVTDLAIAAVPMSAMMAALWVLHFRLGNAAIVDVGWPAGIPLLGLLFLARYAPPSLPALVAVAAALVWGGRLAGYLYATRVHGGAPEEGRYRQLREEWGPAFARKLFGFFQLQALLDIVFALPLWLIVRAPGDAFGAAFVLGVAVWAAGVIGESLADWQLTRFKADPANRGQICAAGLWAYSRHPNYFFEWLVWVGFALMAIGAPWGWLALICPALMLFFLFRVTGIPATEAQALRSKGEAYRRYQRTTNAFFPWFRKREERNSGSDTPRRVAPISSERR